MGADPRGSKRFRVESLRESGMLWAINRRVLHPDGFELIENEYGGLWLAGWHRTPLSYSHLTEDQEDDAWRRFRNTLTAAESHNKPEQPAPLLMPFTGKTG